MEFFDKKEEVIDVQLTQYGKLLLAKGILKPAYYAFFDDGIIYDASVAGVTEGINTIEDRIKDFPYTKTQYAFHGVETNFGAENKRVASSTVKQNELVEYLPSPYERYNALKYTLSNSDPGNDSIPLATVNALQGSFTNTSISYHTGSMTALPIPQLSASIEYEMIPLPPGDGFEPNTGQYTTEILVNQDLLDSKINFVDGSSMRVNGDGLFLEFIEENSPFKNENFEVEIYEVIRAVDTNSDGTKDKPEELLPLYFSDPDDRPEHLVGTFFDILFDELVGQDRLRLTSKLKRGTFVDSRREPEGKTNLRNQDIYMIPDGPSGRNRFDSAVEDCADDTSGGEE